MNRIVFVELKWVLSLPLIWRNMILMSLLSRVVFDRRRRMLILTTQPDLVLLDIMLPGKDGMTICPFAPPLCERRYACSINWTVVNHILALRSRRRHPQSHAYSTAAFCWRTSAPTCSQSEPTQPGQKSFGSAFAAPALQILAGRHRSPAGGQNSFSIPINLRTAGRFAGIWGGGRRMRGNGSRRICNKRARRQL